MYRFTRSTATMTGAQFPQALQFGIAVTKHLNEKYGIGLKVGYELFNGSRVYWYFDAESLDAIQQLNLKLTQDAEYWAMIEKSKDVWLPGSLEDRVVSLVG